MRILIITNTFPCASETFIRNHIEGLLRHGHAVTVLAKRGEKDGPPPPPGAEIIYYAAPDRRSAPKAAFGVLLSTSISKPHRALRCLSFLARGGDPALVQVLAAARLLEGREFDLVHCEFGSLGAMGLLLRDFGLVRGPVVTSFRGSDISSYVGRKPRAYDLLKDRGDLFFPVCSAFARRLESLGFPGERIRVYRSAIDVEAIPFRERSVRPHDVPVLLAAGRFVEKKGFSHAIRTLCLLSDRFPAARLIIVGDGPLCDRLQAEADAAGLSDRIEMPGWLPQAKLLALMAEADVFLGTSVGASSGDVEGIPNILKEAMASGLPVVAFDHSGVSDLVRDGETGFLVSEGDAEAMAERAALVLSRDAAYAGIAVRARRAVEEGYSLEGQALEAERLYEEATPAYAAAALKGTAR
jgi:colanic acid/amylovoran biosynthesis glycosyltransferase